MATPPALRLDAVGREFGGVVALERLDMVVPRGSCTMVVGRNGSGKTTTLRLAAGRLDPTSGIVEVAGRRTTTEAGRRHVRRSVAFALDAPLFYPDLTVEDHLGFVATAHGLGDVGTARTDDLLDRFDLSRRRGFLPDQLSSGMRQKLQLACLFLRPADLVLLDEPTRALDPHTRGVLWQMLHARREAGTAVVFSTHQLDFPAGLVDQVVVLHDGVVADHGGFAEVMDGAAVTELGLT